MRSLPCVVLLLLGCAPALADGYVFDKGHSFVRFGWNHLGLSHQSGRIGDIEGTLSFDAEHPEHAAVAAKMLMGTLSTGVRELDTQLKSKEYFDTVGFPQATFKSTGVTMTGPRTGHLTGDLTLTGQTHPVTLDVTWNLSGEHPLAKINPVYADLYYSGFSAHGTLYRSDWGITRTIPYVSDEIEITIEVEAKRVSVDLAPVLTGEAPASGELPGRGVAPPTGAVTPGDLPPLPFAAPAPAGQPQDR